MIAEPYLTSNFLISSSKISQLPDPAFPEYAFVGRSNVGKSSLINMLTGRKDLAKTSGRPGKTQLINHFSIAPAGDKEEVAWYLVDLPGYGYARVSKTLKAEFQKLIMPFLEKRESLMCVFVLIDARHTPQEVDMDFMERLGTKGIPFAMIFTKADKLKPKPLEENIAKYNARMLEIWEELPTQYVSSSESGLGRVEILNFIDETNKLFVLPN
ncbi:YihA family ribosome biogenesis GTP-binding protein [Cryomorpha ignava]|uniref:Probable GTP-binding protein EngB n=1 Tax=Cryomorpha ignava TaxID=101383 RepID=A0A7K3WMT9_9FLAO|nr:ribosome biogenesis GTP-binding protein YihA/YsxC [Cryomorpha ignava]NEN22967.1 YihA family ribosome biogenesis GTP-binding protein [Cryomorpha ignava]